jgi:transcription elongation factor S-II
MDTKTLGGLINGLQKALNDKEPASNVIAILDRLKKEVEPTEELLRV